MKIEDMSAPNSESNSKLELDSPLEIARSIDKGLAKLAKSFKKDSKDENSIVRITK